MSLNYQGQSRLTTNEINTINTEIVVIEQDAKTKITTTQLNTNTSLFKKFLTDFFSTYKITRSDGYVMQATDYVSFYNELDNTFDITSDYATSYAGAMTIQFQSELQTLQSNLQALITSSGNSLTTLINNAVQQEATDISNINTSISTNVGVLNTAITNLTNKETSDIATLTTNLNTTNNNVSSLTNTVSTCNNNVSTLQTAVSILQSNPVSQPVDLTPINTQISSINSAITTLQNTVPSQITMGSIQADSNTSIYNPVSLGNEFDSVQGLPFGTYLCPLMRYSNSVSSDKISFFGDGQTQDYNYNFNDRKLNVPNLSVGSVNVGTTLSTIQTKQTTDESNIATNTSNIATLQTQVAPYTTGLNPYINSKNFITLSTGTAFFNNFTNMVALNAKQVYVKLVGGGAGGGGVNGNNVGSGGGAGAYYEGIINLTGINLIQLYVYVGSGGSLGANGMDTVISTSSYRYISAGGGKHGNTSSGAGVAPGGLGGVITSDDSSNAHKTDILSSSGTDGYNSTCVYIAGSQYGNVGAGGNGYFGTIGAGGAGSASGKSGFAIISW